MTDSILAGLVAGYAVSIPVGALAVLLVNLAARTSLRTGLAGALGVATADGAYAAVAVAGGAVVADAARQIATPLRWGAALVLLGVAAHIILTELRTRHRPAPTRARARASAPTSARTRTRARAFAPTFAGAFASARAGTSAPAPTRARARVRPGDAGRNGPHDDPDDAGRPIEGQGGGEARHGEARGGDDVRGGEARGGGWVALDTPLRAYFGLLGLTLLNPWAIIYFSALMLGHQAVERPGWSAPAFVVAIAVASLSWQALLACGGAALGRVLTAPRPRLIAALLSAATITALAATTALTT